MTAFFPLKLAATLAAALALQTVAAHAGTVRFCNETDRPIQISVGYSEPGSAFTTRGWWSAAAGQCTGLIARGSKGKYYVHIAKAGGEPIALRSDSKPVSLCVSATRFEDRFREHFKDDKLDCASGGLTVQKFVKIEAQPDGQDVFALQADGTLKASTAPEPQPRPQPPVQSQPKPPAPNEKIVTPQPNKQIAAPAPQATPSKTPDACRRYPNLC